TRRSELGDAISVLVHPQVRPNAVKRNQEERNMPRIMHRVYGPALPAAILLIGIGAMGMGGAAAQGSPEARQACTPDAMRLCSDFTSDVTLTTKCMMAKRAQLSPECRAAM